MQRANACMPHVAVVQVQVWRAVTKDFGGILSSRFTPLSSMPCSRVVINLGARWLVVTPWHKVAHLELPFGLLRQAVAVCTNLATQSGGAGPGDT